MKRILISTIVFELFLCVLLNIAPVCGQVRTRRNTDAQPLLGPQAIERSIKGDETHTYQINLAAKQYVRVEVEQKGIDVTVSLLDSDGKLVAKMDGDASYLWRQSVSAIAERGGKYKLQISGKGSTKNAGSYTAQIAELRKSTAPDLKRVRAEQTLIRAIKSGRANNAKEASEIYGTALNLWKEVGDKFWTATTMLLLSKELLDEKLEADALAEFGNYYFNYAFSFSNRDGRNSNFQRAIVHYKNAYSIYDKLKSRDALVGKISCSRYIGSSYSELTETEKAIPYFQLSLNLVSEFERACEQCDLKVAKVILYGDMGFAYFSEGNDEDALRYLAQVDYGNLEYWKDKKDVLKHSLDLLDMVLISSGDVAEYESTIKTYELIVKNSKFYGYQDEDLMGFYLSLGKAYTEAGYYDLAKSTYDKSLEISLGIQRGVNAGGTVTDINLRERARSLESTLRNNIGIVYLRNGNFDKAQTYIQAALDVASRQNDSLSVVKWKANLAGVYARQKKYNLAITYFDEVIPQLKKLRHEYATRFASTKDVNVRLQEKNLAAFVGIDLYYYGAILRETGKLTEAVDYHKESIQVLNQYKFRKFEARARVELGLDYLTQNKPNLAVEEFKTAYSLSTSAQARDEQAAALDGLMRGWEALNGENLAIVYGKQSVNLLQRTRTELERLGKSVASEFVKDNENIYRRLANLLISEGRFPEAQIILDLLKEEEYKAVTRSGETPDTIPYSKVEADVITNVENLIALERERDELEKIRRETGNLSAEQLTKHAKLDSEIDAANKAFDRTLNALGDAVKSSKSRVNEIKEAEELQGTLTRLGAKTSSGVVALYTVLGTEETKDVNNPAKAIRSIFGWVIMVTPSSYKAYPINVEKLKDSVFQFRNELLSVKSDPRPSAEKIYTAIFRQTSDKQKRTLEQDLQDYLRPYTDKTIMWSLDSYLRYIPMAALHDGKQYLIENYRNVVFSKNSIASLMEDNQDTWIVLGVGVSEKRGNWDALPAVRTELETIIREPNRQGGILNGRIELDGAFQKQKFFGDVRSGAFTVAHIASHYSFDPVRSDESFLLTGDGNLTFAEMSEKRNLFGALDLLTLSACDTGLAGNGKEAEGFAYLAQSLGAKSVIASLWKVSDAGTSEFMIRFYRLRADHPEMAKGEAFRQAQLSLLTGKAHPHYWASFVLIGNWRK